MIRPPCPLTERTQRHREFQCVDKNVQTIRVLCFWNRPKAPRSCCLHLCLHPCLPQMVAGSAIAASHLRCCPACECLSSKEYTFLPTGNPFGAMLTKWLVHHLPTRKKSLPVLDGVGRAKIWKIFEMYKYVWINHFPHIEAAQPRFLGLWGRHKFVCTSGAVPKSQKSQANSNTKSTGRLYVDKYASSAENESSD